jgi:hypothetical protein
VALDADVHGPGLLSLRFAAWRRERAPAEDLAFPLLLGGFEVAAVLEPPWAGHERKPVGLGRRRLREEHHLVGLPQRALATYPGASVGGPHRHLWGQVDLAADELDAMSSWLALLTDSGIRKDTSADKAAVLAECAARDLRAACWMLKPADHTLPYRHLAVTPPYQASDQ